MLLTRLCDRFGFLYPFLLASSKRNGDTLAKIADAVCKDKADIHRHATGDVYLTRWVLRGARAHGSENAVYLHRFHMGDLDEMHDHPWPFTSVILSGGYWESTPGLGWYAGSGVRFPQWRAPGSVLRRPAGFIHRVEIPPGQESWSLVFRGARVGSWGFWCDWTEGKAPTFVPWWEHASKLARSGSGCGE